MTIIKDILKKASAVASIAAFAVCVASSPIPASAASTPSLALTNLGSTIRVGVSGADPNATVMFSFPNGSVSGTGAVSYSSIDLGQTDAGGSFAVSVAPNSYSLNGGTSVYVAVDGAQSGSAVWPASTVSSGQSSGLSLSQQSVSLTIGQTATIVPTNTSSPVSVQANSNPSTASAYFQSGGNSIILTGLSAGSSTISICAASAGCAGVAVSVQAPTQTVSFSQSPAYIIAGQSAQTIAIYGPGSYYGLMNTNKDAISASINGANLALQGLAVGQATITVCADGWNCGSVVVRSLTPGSAIPSQATLAAPTTAGFNQPPQISSLSISSNDVLGLFFGAGSTVTVSFTTNETVNNVQARIAGAQATVTQGTNGSYYVSYSPTGHDSSPLPVALSFADLNGRTGYSYFWIGDSSAAPAAVAAASSAGIAASYAFAKNLSLGMDGADVSALQERLKADGLYAGPISGYFGSQTKAAVERYQSLHGLSKAGAVGAATRKLLNKGI